MPKAIRIHQYGGPEALRWEEVEVGDPGPGQIRVLKCRGGNPPARPICFSAIA